jgi:hypothetical protein
MVRPWKPSFVEITKEVLFELYTGRMKFGFCHSLTFFSKNRSAG